MQAKTLLFIIMLIMIVATVIYISVDNIWMRSACISFVITAQVLILGRFTASMRDAVGDAASSKWQSAKSSMKNKAASAAEWKKSKVDAAKHWKDEKSTEVSEWKQNKIDDVKHWKDEKSAAIDAKKQEINAKYENWQESRRSKEELELKARLAALEARKNHRNSEMDKPDIE
jgi:hypothetical protein